LRHTHNHFAYGGVDDGGYGEHSMIHKVKTALTLLAAFAAGALATVVLSLALGLYAFQSEFYKAFRLYQWLNEDYWQPVSAAELADGAVAGIMETLGDPYGEYIKGERLKEFEQSLYGEFEGIGADIQSIEGHIVVISPIRGSPAEKAGLLPNDRIVEADGRRLEGLSLEEVANIIRGPKGTEVTLLIRRDGIDGDFRLVVKRDTIPERTVSHAMLDGGVAVIHISEFSATTYKEFSQVWEELAEKDVQGFILDLRQNPGGVLSDAVDVASHFVPKDRLITVMHGRDGIVERKVSRGTPPEVPVAVLIDEGTASSAEIMAAALRDSAGATLVGERSFGKGTSQRVRMFDDGTMVKYTFNEAVAPSGERFHGVGLAPDVEVALPEYAKFPPLHPEREYRVGDFHPDIGLTQRYLDALGFPPGRTDGFFDETTEEAVAAFQNSVGLSPGGVLDRRTLERLSADLEQLKKDRDPQLEEAVRIVMAQSRAQ